MILPVGLFFWWFCCWLFFSIFFAKINFLCWSWCHNLNGFDQHNFNAIPNEEEFADPFWNATYVRCLSWEDSGFMILFLRYYFQAQHLVEILQKQVFNCTVRVYTQSMLRIPPWEWRFFGSSLEQGGRQQRKLHRHPSHLGTLVCSSLKPCAAWCTIFTSNLDNLDNLGSVWFCFYSLETIRHCKLSISPRSLSISNTLPSQSPSRKSESQLSRERHFDVKCIEMWCGPWSTLQKIGPVSQDHYGIKMIKWLRL